MKIVYHPKMMESYDRTPAGAPSRIDSAVAILEKHSDYEFIKPTPASEEDILRAHTRRVYERVKKESESYGRPLLYELALLAAGGAIQTAEIACSGDPAFGLLRPPGHHASRDSYWGFCYFSNMALALLNLRARGIIQSAFVLDFDLHVGDGTLNILGDDKHFTIYNPQGGNDEDYLEDVKSALDRSPDVDIIGASAGFDQYIHDWGGNVSTKGFNEIGNMMLEFAQAKCDGRRFGILEGGYNFEDLGKNVLSFCEGLQGR